jgi:hypothetical protein
MGGRKSDRGLFFGRLRNTQSSPVGAGRAAVGTFDFREDDYVKSLPAQVV